MFTDANVEQVTHTEFNDVKPRAGALREARLLSVTAVRSLNIRVTLRLWQTLIFSSHQRERKKTWSFYFYSKANSARPPHDTRRSGLTRVLRTMSDAGDEIHVDAPEVEVSQEAPKGKMSVEDALKVCPSSSIA